MTYRLDRALFIEDGPAARAAQAAAERRPARFIPWRQLDSEHRLTIVEDALKAPGIDGIPLAL